MSDWTRDYFERGYAQRWGLPAPSDEVRLQADGLWELLQLSPASRVIDIGCGHGRHAIVLAERGAEAIGVDSAAALLNRARHLAAEHRAHVQWIRGDMRCLPLPTGCAAAAIMMDAFGFFDTEEEHQAVLQEAARVLTTGGRLVLKVVNGASILDAFRATGREKRDGVVISVSNTLTTDPPRLTQRISVSGTGGRGEYERRQRLYQVEELCALLKQVGFAVVGVFAGPDGARFEPAASSTMWIVGQRRSATRPDRTSKTKWRTEMMKTLGILPAILVVLSATDQPQRAGAKPPDATQETLVANERALHAAVATADKAAFSSLVLPEGVWASNQGFVPLNLLVNGLEALQDTNWDIVNPHVVRLDENSAIVDYSWIATGSSKDRSAQQVTVASTVWTRRNGKWLAAHHQETELIKR
jgi:ubiquinone/menaquinone biosynthesis C-methylase UbiE